MAILLAVVLFKRFIAEPLKTINLGAVASISPIFATGSAVAFGSVVVTSVGFNVFSKLILNLPGNPLISLTVLTSSITAITGSSSGSLGIVLPNFAQFYLDKGVEPEMIHRVSAIASNIFTVVPQSGVLLTFLALTGLTHKTGFKETFISVAGSTSIALVVIILSNMVLH